MVRRAVVPIAVLAAGLACAACSTGDADVASSPALAALGYDASQNARPPVKLKFSCPDSAGPFNSFPTVLTGPRAAHTVRVGSTWRVRVSEAGAELDAASNTYEVRRKAHGYCVVGEVATPG